MSSYPEAPEGWTPVARRAVGPFTTLLTFRPATGGVVDLAAANAFTALGALCFLVGAVLLLPESATTEPAPTQPVGRRTGRDLR
jgi:hypothetical protein